MQHQAVKACIGDQQVAASAQHKQREPALPRPGGSFGNLVFMSGLDKPAGRTADAEGRKGRKRVVFHQDHQIKATSPGLPHLILKGNSPCRRQTCIQN
jgi:hypothetical protein